MTRRGKNIIVAVTGASGSIYGRQVLDGLLAATVTSADTAARIPEVGRVGLIVSRRGEEVAAWEGVCFPGAADVVDATDAAHTTTADLRVERFSNDDMFASPASGSAQWDAMVIVPASMGCVGRIASGVSGDLIARAADVMLKEGRPLIVVPRETPLNLIHLRNLTTLAQAGAVVLPASPSFYSHPANIEELCATVTDRILARLGIDAPRYEWGAER